MNRFWIYLAFLGLVFSSAGYGEKPGECIKDGVKYGITRGAFRAEWWNYQERGMSYLEGGCLEPALKDIEQAIKLRNQIVPKKEKLEGVACDQRRARTYGMHFVDYFAHRERGIILYQMGRLKEAKQELEFSLSCVESNKAQFYLDLVRRAELEAEGLDRLLPELELLEPKDKGITNQLEVELKGIAKDDGFVKEVWIGSSPVVIPISEKEIKFKEKLKLNPGWNVFKIRVIDLVGKKQEFSWSIFSDREGPEVSFDQIVPISSDEVEVSGEVNDQSQVSNLVFNQKKVELREERYFRVQLKVAPEWKIWFKADDIAGNKTEGVVNLITGPKGANLENKEPIKYVSLLGDWESYQASSYLAFNFDFSPVKSGEVAFSELYWNLKEKYDLYRDNEPPLIKLMGFSKEQTTVYFPEIYLEGMASDPAGLKELSINNRNLLRGERKNMFFNYIFPLSPGVNLITIRAVDIKGNVSEKKIRIVRVIPVVHQLDERMVVSMLPFYQAAKAQEIGAVAYDNLVSSIVQQNRFKFVDRSKVEQIVRELKLSQEQLIDPNYTLKVGKLTQAEGMVMGFVKESPVSIEIYAQLIDVETGAILTEKDVYKEDKSLDALKFLTRALSIRLREDFPILEGKVVKLEGKNATLDLGKSQKIKPGMRVIFFTEQPILDIETGMSLGTATEKIGAGKVIQVSDFMSLSELIGKTGEILNDQLVITK